ncbi:type IV toxin-antitoxin system AbiEi family antitoxin [Mycobacterium sp. M26]|uniref:type IV toxin-antitoxin system AbiEi family antitoxin n=1 Tax=Mycobacterium sp. M26 TaxID=1762962 RepID=UPI00073F953B|nr:type IV toxin-antitoxin system AbiEi family antitoxin [Mycobacterium sp. M26]
MTEVFLGREALGDGLSRHDLRRWYRQLFRGVYVPKYADPTLGDRALGAWLATDRTGVIAGAAASALHGALWIRDDEPIEVLVEERRRQAGMVIRMDRLADDEVTERNGVPVTTPSRTAFELGRYQKRPEALARLDALMRAAPFTAADVEQIMRRYGPVRGVRQLRELLPLIDPGAASPKESWLRLLLIDGGLPVPETQIPVLEGGVPVAYLDMGYRDIKLAFEYDGDQHRSDRRQYVKDLRRLPMVERRGWEVIRVIAEDRPAEILLRAREAYVRRGGAEIDEMARSTRTFAA